MKKTFIAFLVSFAAGLSAVFAEDALVPPAGGPLPVALTFDDAVKEHATIAAPLLAEFGYPASFNIVTDYIGKWNSSLDWDDVRMLAKAGHDIVSHTCSHKLLTKMLAEGKVDQFRHEILDSVAAIESNANIRVTHICLPGNHWNKDVQLAIENLGFGVHEWRRPNIGGGDDVKPSAREKTRAAIRKAIGDKRGRLALMFHGIEKFGWRPFPNGAADLRSVFEELRELEKSGVIKVVPYAEAYPRKMPASEPSFRVSFDDGSAVAETAAGEPKPLEATGLEFVDGVKGRGVRLDAAANSALAYAEKGNLLQEQGTVTMWAKCEWPKDEKQTFAAVGPIRVMFSNPKDDKRIGSHQLMMWWNNRALRSDVSDDRDSYCTASPAWALDGAWHHFAFAWDSNAMHMYVDGEPVGLGKDSDSALKAAIRADSNGGAFYSFSKRTEFDRFFIGCRNDGVQWDGCIDEVSVYPRVLEAREVAALAREFGVVPITHPDYRASYARSGGNPYVGAPAENPGEIPAEDLELVDEIVLSSQDDLDRLVKAERVNTVGEVKFGRAGGRGYAELGEDTGSRMALRFPETDAASPLYVFDIDYPDDKVRTMDIIVQCASTSSSDYTMQCGVACGGEYASTGGILTHRTIWWRRPGDSALVVMTARNKAPAALARARLYKIKSGKLPSLKVSDPGANADGWRRNLSLYFEDPAIGYDFSVPGGHATIESMGDLIDRTVATMRFCGENLFAYPGAWYAGQIDAAYQPRIHAPEFLSGWYEKFDAEKDMYVVPTLNINDMPVPEGLVTMDSMTNGSLHSSIMAIHDTGLPNWGKWHGTPPNFNIAHPQVRRWLDMIVDRLVEQGASHPSFKGICLHVTRHCLLAWGGVESGYNDYCIDEFEKYAGVKAPCDRSDPLRGKAYAEWIRSSPELFEKWLSWRCKVVADYWGGVAKRMHEKRPDLKLWFSCFTTSFIGQDYATHEDYLARANREAGLDPALLDAAAPNIILAQNFVPADYRWRNWVAPELRELELNLGSRPHDYDIMSKASFPWVGQHDRYWESPIGRGKTKDGKKNPTLSCSWLKECGWRVSTINPAGANALRPYVLPLRFNDVLGMSKGGFLIGTYGMESELAKFARAYRALPAVRMQEFFREGNVVARMAEFNGKTYGYVVNTDATSVKVELKGLPEGSRDCTSGTPIPSTVALGPYEMVSFLK